MSSEEKFAASEEAKRRGTELFTQGKYNAAYVNYKHSFGLLDSDSGFSDDEKMKKKDIVKVGELNCAACLLKLKKYNECVEMCGKVLKVDGGNVKAMYRRGCANAALNNLEDALRDFKRVLEVDPTNAPAKSELSLVNKKLKAYHEREKSIYSKLFS